MQNNTLNIGLFGYGCVGKGFASLATNYPELNLRIKKICIRDAEKPRDLDAEYFTTDADSLLLDDEINVIVELISDADAAFLIVKQALCNGKAVVSANKKMLAEHLEELVSLQQQFGVPLLYEGSVCGSIPVIRNLENYYDKEPLLGIEGIINGSTNYILTKLHANDIEYKTALAEAQALGFAEADPTLDVEGYDPVNKLCILLLHAFGIFIKPESIFHKGITGINAVDIAFAKKHHCRIKLLAKATQTEAGIQAYVLPHLVNGNSNLTAIDFETNSVAIHAAWSDLQQLTGKGAGSIPTGSAVLSDVLAIRKNYCYPYKKSVYNDNKPTLVDGIPLRIYLRAEASSLVDTTIFEEIEETFKQEDNTFYIGKTKLEILSKASWVKDSGVSLIAL